MKARAKPKPADKAAPTRRTAIARLVPSSEPNIDDEAEERQRAGVQSLGRAFAILEEIARHREGIGLAELSKLVGLHNSTTFHLAKTMVSLGYIRQERDSKRYRVGRPLFALAASALDEIEMVNLATPILEDLSRETGESGHFAVRMGDAVIVIARTSGPGAFQLTDRVGVVRPAHCTALGKIILASLRPDQLKRFLERVELKPSTRKSITEPAVLLKEIAEIRRTRDCLRRWRVQRGSPLRRRARLQLHRRRGRCARHLRPDLAHDRPGHPGPRQDREGGRESPLRRIRRRQLRKTPLDPPKTTSCGAFGVDRAACVRKYSPTIKKRLSHSRIRDGRRGAARPPRG